jgi:DNA-binding Lrp family transcriptional regulator
MMVTAIVLLNVERKRVNQIADDISEIKGVSEVYSVSGTYDLACIIRTTSNEDLADIITSEMLQIQGIVKSETMLAFKCFSKHDLESMFAIGLK